ncbi:hypothetical protein F5X96DRAFT_453754 [Biscogniauxia mediterranea]|nr:hypothetical protein F5X96DRAFT_453754 [Biscogniauxia mediterranea]
MKAATALIVLFSALAAAGVIPRNDKEGKYDGKDLDMPGCAKKCAKKFYKEGQCQSEDDHACLCSSSVFHRLAGPCIEEKCNKQHELEELSAFVSRTCGQMSWNKEPEAQTQPPTQPPTQHMPNPEPMPQPMPKTGY